MKERTTQTLQPSYMKDFRCIGGDCEHNCCAPGWRIAVDQRSYERYLRVKDGELGALLAASIERNPAEQLKPQYYASIRLNEKGLCPFLNDRMMCRLQAEMGEKYLCNVCYTYPRVTNRVDGVLERGLSLSCPEAARQALRTEGYMEFDEGLEEETGRDIIALAFRTDERITASRPQQLFWTIRHFTVGLLQNRDYAVWERMMILGLCLEKIQGQLDQNARLSEITQTLEEYGARARSRGYVGAMKDIPLKLAMKMTLVSKLFAKRLGMGGADALFGEAFCSLVAHFQNADADEGERFSAAYLQARERSYKPFMACHEHMLEHFMVNHVFLSAFPYTQDATLFQAYMQAAILFSIVNTMMIGLCMDGRELTEEMLLEVVHSVSFTIVHHPAYLADMARDMSAKGQDNMAYMAMLIAN